MQGLQWVGHGAQSLQSFLQDSRSPPAPYFRELNLIKLASDGKYTIPHLGFKWLLHFPCIFLEVHINIFYLYFCVV